MFRNSDWGGRKKEGREGRDKALEGSVTRVPPKQYVVIVLCRN